jgi:hypothetical protein
MRHDEALEIVLPKYILIPPEEASSEHLASSEGGTPTIGETIE